MEIPQLLDGEEYRNFFNQATEGIFQSTVTGRFRKVNPAMARIYGYNSSVHMVASVSSISKQIYVDPQDRERFLQELDTSGYVEGFECRNYRADGSIIWIRANARAVTDESGQIQFIEGFVTDVTARKEIEEALEENVARYRALVEYLPATVFLDSAEKTETTQYISPQIEDLLGYTPEEWVADSNLWGHALHPEDRERVRQEQRRTDKSGESFREEYRLRRKDGK